MDLDAMLDEDEDEEPIAKAEQTELELPAPELLAAAAPAATAAPASAPAPIILPAPPSSLSRPQIIGGTVILSLSLLLSLAALWMGLGLGSQVDTLNQNVSELQQRVIAQSRRGTINPQAQLGEQLNRLGERVNELAVIVEGPVAHLQESSQLALETLSLRLDRMEQGQPVATTTAKSPATVSQPLVSAPAANKDGWVINLLSVGSARAADEEMVRLRKLGIRADKQKINREGKIWYRLRVTGFDSYAGAKAYVDTVEKQTGFSSAWVAKE
jgi:cell division septation protein DedD